MNTLLHTPEGVRDLYGKECVKKKVIEKNIENILHSYGYLDIDTPSFEYFDIFNKERGSVPSKEMFKLFDREGNTLVFRPDVTPQIARIAAKYYSNEIAPIKLCYNENKYINGSSYRGRLKETKDIGAELIGDSSIDGDAEMIVLLVKSLLANNLSEFQVEIGHIDYFRGFVDASGIDEEVEYELMEMIQNKNYFGIDELIKTYNIDKATGVALTRIPQMFGSVEILDEALALATNERSRQAISHLKELFSILKSYGVEKYVTFDLGMLNKLRYYTGIMFQAFTYGSGDYIASGGRYDKLIKQFGSDKPAIGFSITVDYLLLAINRQNICLDTNEKQSFLIIYNQNTRLSAIRLSDLYREKDINVSCLVKDNNLSNEYYLNYAKNNGVVHVIFLDNQEELTMIHVNSGNIKKEKLSAIFE